VPGSKKNFTKDSADYQALTEVTADFPTLLRERARPLIRKLLEDVLQEEMTAFLQAAPGEQGNPNRQGRRNGYYQRDLITTGGKVENIKVPRERAGQFQPELFKRYNRYQPEVEETVEQMWLAGVSYNKVGQIAEKLTGQPLAPKRAAAMTAGLTEQFEAARQANLEAHYRVIYLDGVYYPIVHEDKADQTAVLVALGVDEVGNKKLLAIHCGAEESKTAWLVLLTDLARRGVSQVDLFVTDGGEGVIAALAQSFSSSKRQRCVTHKMRNVLAHIPHRKKAEIGGALKAIYKQTSQAEALAEAELFAARYEKAYPAAVTSLQNDFLASLAYYDFDKVLWRYLRTTNALEGLFSNVRLRTNSVKVFASEESCMRMVWAVSQTIQFQRMPVVVSPDTQS
jgi:putative transposase